jgi:nitrous oxidase accessory protein NosD
MVGSAGRVGATFAILFAVACGSAQAATVDVGPGDSIQAAIDAARPGDTVRVTGEHRENLIVQTRGLRMLGSGAVLKPPVTPAHNLCFDPASPEEVSGICVVGRVDPETFDLRAPVGDVVIDGFRVEGFGGDGIIAFGAHNARFSNNAAIDDAGYGITAFVSSKTRMLFNRASGAEEAAFYIGDSPEAGVQVQGNEASDSRFGILIRNARHGRILFNSVHDNCVGIGALADLPGPTGFFTILGNTVTHNNAACEGGDEGPASSGIGIGLLGADHMRVAQNTISDNVASGPTEGSGGVLVVSGPAGAPPSQNVIMDNVFSGNDPDITWDGTGTNVVIRRNDCTTSVPAARCG